MLINHKPVTPGLRGRVSVSRRGLWKGAPEKSLTVGKKRHAGRNNQGRITCRHKGGGHKRSYRTIEGVLEGYEGKVERIEYDPNRTAHIALLSYAHTSKKTYALAAHGSKPGDVFTAVEKPEIKSGTYTTIRSIPIGTSVFNIQIKIGGKSVFARSAGSSAQILGRDGAYVTITLPSGEVRKVHGLCKASVGTASNPDHKNEKLGKAGRSRWKGIRPTVRGVAMNPVDHPMGGGEGKTSGGGHPVSPWGWKTKGKKTRNPKKPSSRYIIRRRK